MDPITIDALLVRGEHDQVRVILDPYCLDFAVDDVVSLEELPLPAGVTEGSAVAARLTLAPGARLLGLGSAHGYRNIVWGDGVPFTLVTRPAVSFQADNDLKAREHAFFAARGLTEHR